MEIRKLLSSNTSSPLVGIQGQGKLHSASRSTSSLAATPQSFARTPRLSQTSLEEPPSALAIPASVDPHVAGFLRSVLGTRKWRIFSSKLCERKDVASESSTFRGNEVGTHNGLKGKAKQTPSTDFDIDEDGVLHGGTSPCAIAFLVKVEVVKEVLRNYVPNPYNPLKAESHQYPPAPSGIVHVTRASVLALCQWSNTQFAYWSRRSEAVSVLAYHDAGLRDLFFVLYRRLYEHDPPSHAFSSSSSPPSVSWSSIGSSCGSPPPPSSSTQHSAQSGESEEAERRLAVARNFTGKGLDGLIAEIKRRSGASQFLRGRQSSLDPFGAHLESGSASYDPNWPIVMPSFHGKHTHSRASSDSYDFTSMTPLLTSPMSQPATTSSQGPSRTLLQSAYRMEPPKRYEKHSAMIMPHYDDSTPFMFPQSRHSYSRDSSGSPHSRASTAGSKRKREEDAFSSDEGCSTAVDVRRPTRLRAVSDLFRTRFSGGKRAKVDH
ncbi:hypothetical protein FRC18_010792 [Serendipita sp. 400]|nr:hypothetical protein FRC18_010792 [Serendipita sp. 400]